MLNFAWDQERALEVRAEEAKEKRRKEGMEKGLASALCNLMENLKWPAEKAMDALSIPRQSAVDTGRCYNSKRHYIGSDFFGAGASAPDKNMGQYSRGICMIFADAATFFVKNHALYGWIFIVSE